MINRLTVDYHADTTEEIGARISAVS